MNAQAPSTARFKQPPPATSRRNRRDQEFLPAAIEILETPPSPVGIAFLWIICIFTIAALTWCWFGRLDVVAIAQGKVQPTGRVKIIQPKEMARIASVLVENGQHVAKGETLAILEASDADADVRQLKVNLDAVRAEADRRLTALTAARAGLGAVPAIAWTSELPAAIRTRETHVLEGDLGQLATTLDGLMAQLDQKTLEVVRYEEMMAAFEDLVGTLRQRVEMRTSLEQSGSGSRADLMTATEALQDKRTDLVAAKGQRAESRAAIEVLRREIARTRQAFVADNLLKLSEAERQADDIVERLAKAEARQREMVIKSPIDGTVSALSVTTPGQVAGAGEELMRVVPDGIGLEIETYIANRDIGFIHTGQEATVKIESLPFTRYGTIKADLVKIASDAIPQPEAEKVEGNPAQSQSERGFAGAQRTQNLVFPAILKPREMHLSADGVDVPLSPGMAVTVEIKTGSRRIMEYLLSPLVEVASGAMKER
ncbi:MULTISPECIES: HlyD family type I secretion periplasmic adaptor subunit [unclassified Aureimonas]|uniref:HlyD family type I secretion periplasmic adaptor subunit n=1 Tax=unclassified Aureimonas TaxID=2615206 RepID=UPI0009EB7CF1|nr:MULTISPECIES: HlyD family type I secretion periplasmic adaptor subunit [unclassified Aureimonas]